jgi:hypothetical protein
MSKRRSALLALVIIAGALCLLPWKSIIETRAHSALDARGLEKLQFHIDAISPRSVTLKDLSFGSFALQSLTVGYSLRDLWNGNIHVLNADHIAINQSGMNISFDEVHADLAQGTWAIPTILTKDMPLELPLLTASGTITTGNDNLHLTGIIKSTDNRYNASFTLDSPLSDTTRAKLVLSSVTMPWNGGTLNLRNTPIMLFSTAPINLTLNVQRVSLNALLALATSNRATATGTVSGNLPITIARDGTFTFKPSTLKADDNGTITLQPDLIPCDNAQVALVREVLKNFHYNTFSLGIESNKDKKLSMLLSLHGNNPDAYNGRAVNLNVHLGGDVLDLLQQSILPFTDAKQLLKQGSNAQK